MQLVRPSMEWKEGHEAYMNEWDDARMTPSIFQLQADVSYEDYLQHLAFRESGAGRWLPSTSCFYIDDDRRIVGMIDIRHELDEHMLQVGGHVGYGVRPSERKKGYATRMLAEALKKTDALGIQRVLVTCNSDNEGSAKVILNNGGAEDESFTEDDGTVVRRFWIDRLFGS